MAHLLAGHIDDDLVPAPKVQWVHDQKLVPRALTELLGNQDDGWTTERREGTLWVRGLRPVASPGEAKSRGDTAEDHPNLFDEGNPAEGN